MDLLSKSVESYFKTRGYGQISIVSSIAGYRGNWDFDKRLKLNSKQILDNMINNHKDLKCNVTIPFASFIYFSDNVVGEVA